MTRGASHSIIFVSVYMGQGTSVKNDWVVRQGKLTRIHRNVQNLKWKLTMGDKKTSVSPSWPYKIKRKCWKFLSGKKKRYIRWRKRYMSFFCISWKMDLINRYRGSSLLLRDYTAMAFVRISCHWFQSIDFFPLQ